MPTEEKVAQTVAPNRQEHLTAAVAVQTQKFSDIHPQITTISPEAQEVVRFLSSGVFGDKTKSWGEFAGLLLDADLTPHIESYQNDARFESQPGVCLKYIGPEEGVKAAGPLFLFRNDSGGCLSRDKAYDWRLFRKWWQKTTLEEIKSAVSTLSAANVEVLYSAIPKA